MSNTNDHGQPIGHPLPDNWTAPAYPEHKIVVGTRLKLEPVSIVKHAKDLHEANLHDVDGTGWTYLPYGPFDSLSDYEKWLEETCCKSSDPMFFAYVNRTDNMAIGLGSYLRINPHAASIEVGHIRFSPLLQRTPMATEAMFLMMKHAFEFGYRRYEWKCDALNAPSRRAAERLGFKFEGIFRQATHYKGRNRDTAWYAIMDHEWPALKLAHEQWLAPKNFDADGQQVKPLEYFMTKAQS